MVIASLDLAVWFGASASHALTQGPQLFAILVPLGTFFRSSLLPTSVLPAILHAQIVAQQVVWLARPGTSSVAQPASHVKSESQLLAAANALLLSVQDAGLQQATY
jgi:hypothetical protein